MANVQVAKALQYTSVPTSLIPEQWYNLAVLPNANSNAPFKAYMPVSMANSLGANPSQTSPWGQYAAAVQSASQTSQTRLKSPKPKANPDDYVTKIILSNFEGPITVTCTDVTPKCQNLVTPQMPQYSPSQAPMVCPKPFTSVAPCFRVPSESREFYRPRRSHSKRRSSKKRSKSPKKVKSREKDRSGPSSTRDGRRAKKKGSKSPSRSRSDSPQQKSSRKTAPPPPSALAGPLLSSGIPPHLPPPPTAEQLQSAVLRPVQPRPKPYNIETAQTLPYPEPEKGADRDRSKSPGGRRHPCHCMPMIYCMPSCPYPCHQLRSPRAERRMHKLLEVCEGKTPIKVQIVKELGRSQSVPKPKVSKDWKPRQQPSDQLKRPILSNITPLHAPDVSPLRTVIKPSPPPQQPLHSQGLFGMRKGIPVPRAPTEEEAPSWTRRNDNDDGDRGFFRGDKPSSPRGVSVPQPPPPPQPSPHHVSSGVAQSVANRTQPGPKLGPKPTIQWPPRIRPGGSDKPISPPVIEFGGTKRNSESSEDEGAGGGISQVEGSYEVIWDYFDEDGAETDEDERVPEVEEGEEEQEDEMHPWGGVRFFDSSDSYQRHGHYPGSHNFEGRTNRLAGPSSGSYYNIDSKSIPKVILKVKRDGPL